MLENPVKKSNLKYRKINYHYQFSSPEDKGTSLNNLF